MENGSSNIMETDFPYLIPCDASCSAYYGYVEINNQQYRIYIKTDLSTFHGDSKLTTLLEDHTKHIKKLLTSSNTLYDFLLELREFIERLILEKNRHVNNNIIVRNELPPSEYYNNLIKDINGIGWKNIHTIENQMRVININIKDDQQRIHSLKLEIPLNYPNQTPHIITDLPIPFQYHQSNHQSSNNNIIKHILNQFHICIQNLQDYFNVFQDFDDNTIVLQPEKPLYSHNYRRIFIYNNLSLKVEIEPKNPIKAFTKCRFLGSEKAIQPFNTLLNQRIHLWDTSGDMLPRQNLENILQIEFPRPQNENDTDNIDNNDNNNIENECGICYASRYNEDGNIPEITCDKTECGKQYHKQCLIDWLRALPDTRESFDTLTGKCIYCEETITVSIKED